MKPITNPYDIDEDFYESDEYKASLSSPDWVSNPTLHEAIQKDLQKIRVSSVLERIEKNKKITFSIRSNAESIAKIKAFAKARGIPYQTLINAAIDEFADSLH